MAALAAGALAALSAPGGGAGGQAPAALTDRRGRQRFPYPRGTVVVKTAGVRGTISLVAIMRKVRAGPARSPWRYAEYVRGRAGPGFTKVGGSQALCSGCHVSATSVQGSDSVFTRLR